MGARSRDDRPFNGSWLLAPSRLATVFAAMAVVLWLGSAPLLAVYAVFGVGVALAVVAALRDLRAPSSQPSLVSQLSPDEINGKQEFLVVYDYGMGGVWSFIWARSPAEIYALFDELEVVDSIPGWMTESDETTFRTNRTYDIDHIDKTDWIYRLLRTDQKRGLPG